MLVYVCFTIFENLGFNLDYNYLPLFQDLMKMNISMYNLSDDIDWLAVFFTFAPPTLLPLHDLPIILSLTNRGQNWSRTVIHSGWKFKFDVKTWLTVGLQCKDNNSKLTKNINNIEVEYKWKKNPQQSFT